MRVPSAVGRVAKLLLITLMVATPAMAAASDTVYLSATGTKYHRQSCRTLKKQPLAIQRGTAEKRGYRACQICKP